MNKMVLAILAIVAIAAPLMGQIYVTSQPEAEFHCVIVSTATALTEVTGCETMTNGKKRYITGLQWSSSIISTTTNFFQLTVGTNKSGACDTSARAVFSDFSAPAFSGTGKVIFSPPIVSDANDSICFVHPGAGTRNVSVQGFIK